MSGTKTKGYRGNQQLKTTGVQQNWTGEMLAEYIRCRDDPIYFIEKYVKIVTDEGLVNIVLRDYQVEMLQKMHSSKEVISLQSRQSGKCFSINTPIKLRNKKTGEVKQTTVGEFYGTCTEC